MRKYRFANRFYKRAEEFRTLPFVLSILCMAGGFACVFLAFTVYYVGIVASAAVLICSVLTLRAEKNVASYTGLTLSAASFLVSALILFVNLFWF